MKIKSLIVSVLCLAILALSGCSKSSDSTPAPVSQPTSTTAIAGVASKGPIAGAVVQVFAIRSNVTDTVPFGTGRTDDKGNYAVQTFGYKGPVVVEVTQGAYNDEISGTQVTMKTPLRAMFSSVGTGTTSIAVTPLTELAAKNAEGRPTLSTDAIDAANNYIGVNFGVPGIITTLPIPNSGDANQTNYVNQLKVFQQLVYNSMQPGELAAGQVRDDALATVMTALGNEQLQDPLHMTTTTTAAWAFATSLCNDPLGCRETPPVQHPPANPVGGILKLATVGPATATIFQITLTVTLPAGVTVNTAPGSTEAGGISVHLTNLLDPKTTTLTALVTQSTLTPSTPGKIAIVVGATKSFPPGQFLIINFNLDPATPPPPPGIPDFAMTGVLIQGLKLVTLDGITISPALTYL